MRLVLYTGKGGVGKTTTAATSAVVCAERGLRTLVASADSAHSLGDVFGRPLMHAAGGAEGLRGEPVTLAPRLDALEVDSRAEMARHWGSIRDYLVSLFRYQGIEAVVAEELALLPGAEEIAALLAIERHATSGAYDVIVVDCAPTDTTLRLVTLPDIAHGALRLLLQVQRSVAAVATPLARSVVPVPLPESAVFREAEHLLYRKLRRLRRRLVSGETSVRLVVTPERMVIDEARRAFTDLCLFDIPCDGVVMNRMLPDAALAEAFFEGWAERQDARFREVEEAFAPLPVLRSPLADDEVIGLEALSRHGAALFDQTSPEAHLAEPARLRFLRDPEGYRVELPLPGAQVEELELTKIDDELVVRAGGLRRSIKLPRRIALLDVSRASLQDGALAVYFAAVAGAA